MSTGFFLFVHGAAVFRYFFFAVLSSHLARGCVRSYRLGGGTFPPVYVEYDDDMLTFECGSYGPGVRRQKKLLRLFCSRPRITYSVRVPMASEWSVYCSARAPSLVRYGTTYLREAKGWLTERGSQRTCAQETAAVHVFISFGAEFGTTKSPFGRIVATPVVFAQKLNGVARVRWGS